MQKYTELLEHVDGVKEQQQQPVATDNIQQPNPVTNTQAQQCVPKVNVTDELMAKMKAQAAELSRDEDNTFHFIHSACSSGVTESKNTESYYSRRYVDACRVL